MAQRQDNGLANIDELMNYGASFRDGKDHWHAAEHKS